jgi:hypothetical protein
MGKILLIDGGEQGKRVEEIISLIRKDIPKSKLDIKYSTSASDENGKFHSLAGFNIALIHKSDNLDSNGLPIYNKSAIENKVPIILFSGGIFGFKKISDQIFEVNDTILKQCISTYIQDQLNSGFKTPNFIFFELQFNSSLSKSDQSSILKENIRALKHDYLNKIARILPEINTILGKLPFIRNNNFEFQIEFNPNQLSEELIKISQRLEILYSENTKFFLNSSKSIKNSIAFNINYLSESLTALNGKFNNLEKIHDQLNPILELNEKTKTMFEDLISGIRYEK